MKLPTLSLLIITLLFVQLSSTCCQVGTKQTRSLQKDILSDSSISLYQTSFGGGMFADMVIGIHCKEGKASFTVESRWFSPPEIRKYEQQVALTPYQTLWAQIEKLGVWQLKRGEFWDYRMQIWAHGIRGFPKLEETQEMRNDYGREKIGIHKTIVSVEVSVKNKYHGFMRLEPRALKDERYQQIIEIIYEFIDLTKILQIQRAQK